MMILISSFRPLLDYIVESASNTDINASNEHQKEQEDEFFNAPLFSVGTRKAVAARLVRGPSNARLVPQYGLLGMRLANADPSTASEDRLILGNMNAPWSAFICGSQGAGKSHTLSCLLEAALLRHNMAGALTYPLAGLVFHYDSFTSLNTTQLCEAAYLCSSGIPVRVMASPSNIWALHQLYTDLPGLPKDSPRPKVVPLYFDEEQLNISRILKLMSVDTTAKAVPLYMEVVSKILRETAMSGKAFRYQEFRRQIADTKWVGGQEVPLNMRLQLMDSFLSPKIATQTTKPAAASEDIWTFEPGTLTIVDLSDPFLSSGDACCLFTMCLSIFLEKRAQCGQIIAIDEAHKFLQQSGEAQILTQQLTSVIRQQRHTGTRVVIATQEPTLSPDLIDLSNATFIHRFTSPAWYNVLRGHLAGGTELGVNSDQPTTLFDKIVGLRTGEALVFCPTAQIEVGENGEQPRLLGNHYLKMKMRKRITVDGGRSVTASDIIGNLRAEKTEAFSIPMHIAASKSHVEKASESSSPQVTRSPAAKSAKSAGKKTKQKNTEARTPKLKLSTKKELNAAVKRYVATVVAEGCWNSFKKLTEVQKRSLWDVFRDSVHLLPPTLSEDGAKSAFFSLLGEY